MTQEREKTTHFGNRDVAEGEKAGLVHGVSDRPDIIVRDELLPAERPAIATAEPLPRALSANQESRKRMSRGADSFT